MQIINNDLLKIENLKNPISHIILLEKLTEENFIYPSTPYILYDEDIINLLQLIYEMSQNPNNSQFNILISKLNENHDLIAKIENIFPYRLFNYNDHPFYMLLYWIPMFKKLYDYKINFRIESIESYDFVFSFEYSGILPTYVFKEENSLYLSVGSNFFFPNENKSLKFPQKSPRNPWSKIFYSLTHLLFDNKSKKYHDFSYTIKSIEYKKLKPKKETNQYLNLSQFYQKNPDCPLISKILPIAFNFSSEIVKILINVLHPLESDIINAILHIYSNICDYKFDQINDFIKWISQIDQQSILLLIYNNQYECHLDDIQKVKDENDRFEREINYFRNSPSLDQYIWLPSKYINILQREKIPLDNRIQKEADYLAQKKLREDAKNLITQLENAVTKDAESSQNKSFIIQQIIQVCESPNIERFEQIKKDAHSFLDNLKKEDGQI